MTQESGFPLGDCGYMICAKVVKIHRRMPIPMGIAIIIAAIWLTISCSSKYPTKKTNTAISIN